MLSYVQNLILTKFLKAEKLKYSECIPEGLDKDLFNYHFKFLKEKSYILKDEECYSLTHLGKKYVQRLDALGVYKDYFRVSVLVYLVIADAGQQRILLHRRLRHPYYGDIGVISGKVQYGEKIAAAAQRKFKEETGLNIDPPRLIGVHRKTRHDKDGEIIEDTLYHCCLASSYKGELKTKTEFGENFWASLDDAKNYESQNIAGSKGGIAVLEKIKSNDLSELFYLEEEQTLTQY